jgi:DNA invertase Pin-like site-specific DNA recombinase
MDKRVIKNVVIYLRKSRGDEDNALENHKVRLTGYAKENGWKFDIFEEGIKSGERLDTRPVMLQVLELISKGMYDGILVTEYTRLSRDYLEDMGRIVKILQFSNTYILTPTRWYDPNSSQDLTMLGIESVFSNTELRTIKSRLQGGKKDGAKQGRWTNGAPPYPYEYVKRIEYDPVKKRDRIVGEVIVNKEHLVVYRRILETYLTGTMGTEQIAIMLNKEGIPGPGGKYWNSNTIQRLLLHQFHMGKIIYGRYQWKRNPLTGKVTSTLRPEDEWIIGEGDHIKTKTKEEHEMIVTIMQTNTKVPHRSRQGIFPTSGLMYCKRCGRRMGYSIGRVEAKTGKKYDYTKCVYVDPMGVKCSQRGVKLTEEFYNALYNKVVLSYLNPDYLREGDNNKYEYELLDEKRKQLHEIEIAIEQILEGYEKRLYTIEQAEKRKAKYDATAKKLKMEISNLEKALVKDKYTREELVEHINNFKKHWDGANSEEKNKLLKSVVKKIIYDRIGDNITLEIEYL